MARPGRQGLGGLESESVIDLRDSKQLSGRVKSVVFKRLHKTVRLEDGRTVDVARFACITKGDPIISSGQRGNERISISCSNGEAQVSPVYQCRDYIRLGGKKIRVEVKEITEEFELEGYLRLASFHYRNDRLCGRRVPLVIVTDVGEVLGYIELTSALFMNRARQQVLDARFLDGDGVGWERWDMSAARRYTNLMVRIARCVIHPEYRGLSCGPMLCRHAMRFARTHWQIGRIKPNFLEITADMLKFLPFVEQAGMVYIGETEGNLARVGKDMEYLIANASRVNGREILKRGGGGIVAVQKRYLESAVQIVNSRGLSVEALADRLSLLSNGLTPGEYASLYGVLRLPKPTYMKGLTRKASAFLRRRVRELELAPPHRFVPPTVVQLSAPIRIVGLSAEMNSSVEMTEKTMRVQEAFGIKPSELRTELFRDLSVDITPGQIVLIHGASGSGKTTLLRILMGQTKAVSNLRVHGLVDVPSDARIANFEPLPDGKPLVELLGDRDVARSLYCLNAAGLSEAQLYLRRFGELSNGQQYRAMLASLIDSGANVWVADEFLATLDVVTASVVAKNVRKHARRSGVTVLLGAAHIDSFVDVLQPDQVVEISGLTGCRVSQVLRHPHVAVL